MEAEGDLERDLRVELDRNADDVGRQLVLLHSLLVDVHEHDGNTRKDLIAKLQRELQRGAEDGHDEIDRFARVFFPEELGQNLLDLVREGVRFVAGLDPLGGAGSECRADALIGQLIRRPAVRLFRVEHHHGPDVRRGDRSRAGAEEQEGRQRHQRHQPREPPSRPPSASAHGLCRFTCVSSRSRRRGFPHDFPQRDTDVEPRTARRR